MKIFRRFLMFFLPVLLLALGFVFFPQFRPDISEFRELRKAQFTYPVEISKDKKTGQKIVSGQIYQQYLQAPFLVLDAGKVRLAIRNDSSEVNGFFQNLINMGGFHSGQDFALLVDPPRDVEEPPPPKKTGAGAAAIAVSPGGPIPATATPLIHETPTGTRIDLGNHMLRFEDGKLTLGEETVSTIEKPILIVLDSELNVELIEDLPEDSIAPDEIRP